MECIKLITSPNYMDKRIGYLGLTLLLTDQEEVLMLVTNSLKVEPFGACVLLILSQDVAAYRLPAILLGLLCSDGFYGVFCCLLSSA